MSAINAATREAWQGLAQETGKARPHKGRRVEVKGGKHKGKQGTVTRHQIDKFAKAYRYGSSASHMMMDLMGTHGWCCLIETGSETFWTKATNVTCLAEA